MDFMNLNQAAHGDREFGYIQTRLGVARKTVAGHVSDPRVVAPGRRLDPGRARLAEMRSLRLARFGDNMRDVAVTEGDKVEARAALRRLGQHLRRQRPGRGRRRGRRRAGRRRWSRSTTTPTGVAAAAAAGRRPARRRCATRPASRLGLRDFLEAGGFRAFTTNFEDLGGLRQLPGIAVQRLMADGYGFGGEGDWKTSVLVRTLKAMAVGVDRRHVLHGGLHLRPHPGPGAGARRAHARGLPEHRRRTPRTCEIHPLGIGGREDPVRLVFDAAPGPAVVLGLADMGERFRLVANEIDVVAAAAAAAASCRSPARCGGPGPTCHARPRRGSPPAARTTPCCRRRSASRSCTTSPR